MILQTTNLAYAYDTERKIFFPDIALDVGKKILISGTSGCGKTTLLNLIAGALKLQSGEIDLAANQYSSLSSNAIDQVRANHIGYVFQTLNLIPFLSVMDNIALGVKFSKLRSAQVKDLKQEVIRLVTSLGIGQSVLKKSVNHLSVGQQQRVALARALLGKPNLILADEPTSALDQVSSNQFLQELNHTFDSKSQAVLMVSHDLSLAPHFDEVIDLNKTYA